MEAAKHTQREIWDRLILLLIARPYEGWEAQFKEIARREIERLVVPIEYGGTDE
jgi:hypothetical protein